ncbi:N-acetylmuramoyl-L-alanine amidase [Ideonella sp. 4Y16]|uniref:N-acetylmuramoyl-L-alanine amidase n=1 Tax=Ideonella alba TaxID=2824118 RepID=UPI001B3858A5|nr:N-acetylmuramoyl-L-alanine amidase [Ideonella alba]MBQ0942251.1 N-acetylmuramoyl-L-alanine amidase [Ideonella alba]
MKRHLSPLMMAATLALFCHPLQAAPAAAAPAASSPKLARAPMATPAASAVTPSNAAQSAQPARSGRLLRVAIDIGRQPAGEPGQAEFRLNQALGSALARELMLQQVTVLAIPPGLSPAQRARAAEGSDLLLSVNHETLTDAQRQQAQGASGFKVALAGRQAADPVALGCARGVAQALVKGGRPHAAAVVPMRPLLDVSLGVQRQDDLAVLNAASVPAMRLQVAVLANPAEARQAGNAKWVTQQAQQISQALDRCLRATSTVAKAPTAAPAAPSVAPAQAARRGSERVMDGA